MWSRWQALNPQRGRNCPCGQVATLIRVRLPIADEQQIACDTHGGG